MLSSNRIVVGERSVCLSKGCRIWKQNLCLLLPLLFSPNSLKDILTSSSLMSCCCFSRLFILSVVPCLFINLCHWHIRGLREKAVSKCEILRLNYCSYPLYSLPHPAPPLSPSNLPSFCGISQLPSWSHVCWKIQHLFFKERCFSKGSNTTFVVEYVWKVG